jgi:hypothetical protein
LKAILYNEVNRPIRGRHVNGAKVSLAIAAQPADGALNGAMVGVAPDIRDLALAVVALRILDIAQLPDARSQVRGMGAEGALVRVVKLYMRGRVCGVANEFEGRVHWCTCELEAKRRIRGRGREVKLALSTRFGRGDKGGLSLNNANGTDQRPIQGGVQLI